MSKTHRIRPGIKLLIGLSTLLLSLGFSLTPWGKALDRFTSDFFYYLRGAQIPPSEIVLVAIDEPSFGVLQQQWPWPRSLHARLIESLFEAGAKVVAFDIIFAELSTPEEDLQLKEALGRHPTVILAGDFNLVQERNYTQEILVGPHPDLITPETHMGFVNLPVDSDGFVRRLNLFHGDLQSISLESVLLYCGNKECKGFQEFLGMEVSDNLEINFLGPGRTLKTVSYYQALAPSTYLPRGVFQDKLVFVGLVMGGAIEGKSKGVENFPVPFTRWAGGYMSGVEVHGHAAHNLIHNTIGRPVATEVLLLFGLIAGGALAFAFFRLKPAAATGLLVLWACFSVLIPFWLFSARFLYISSTTLLIPSFACYLVSPFLHYWETRKEKNFIRKAFSTYLAPTVVNQLLSSPEQLRLGGEVVEATVLFLDVAGFTSLSERTQPEVLIQVLNRYLGTFADIVFRWNGMIDKFIGDAIMATWGVPIAQSDHAQRACSAALEMQDALERLSNEEEEKGTGLNLQIRIGINSGRMVAGNVGGTRHFNYTVLGDDVNLASRLEGVNKFYGTVITISQHTADRAGAAFVLRELDLVRVKGKGEPVKIYELQGMTHSLGENQLQVNAHFHHGRDFYQRGQWGDAKDCFVKGLSINTDDGPCRLYLERCCGFEQNPPGPDWDCVVCLEK